MSEWGGYSLFGYQFSAVARGGGSGVPVIPLMCT